MQKGILPEPHPVTLGDIRKIIPSHCFKRSFVRSMQYVIQDLCVIAMLFYLAMYIDLIPFATLRWTTWAAYWWIQGAFMTGIWVIAHECGHGSFCEIDWISDIVGCILHTLLFVPYWSWKYSHAQHHSNTDSMERDSVFVPPTAQDRDAENELLRNPIMRIIGIFKMVTIGWPSYLLFDAAGPPVHSQSQWTSHFNPFCNLFVSKKQKIGVIASDIALCLWIWILYKIYLITSLSILIKYYFMPYLVVNFWLVTITFLQHTDTLVPRYRSDAWTWLRGALGTVDRDYRIFNLLHHHIGDTHVVHHIFSKIPHYNAVEATEALKKSGIIHEYYLQDKTPWYQALWRCYRDCWFVGDQEQVTWFHSCKEMITSNQKLKSI